MSRANFDNWLDANHNYLNCAVDVLRHRLMDFSRKGAKPENASKELVAARKRLQAVRDSMPAPPAIEVLGEAFKLSSFEKDMVILTAGTELDPRLRELYAAVQGAAHLNYPSFNLAMTVLKAPHWSALLPSAPLRFWRILEIHPAEGLLVSRLRLDERVLHYLVGIQHLDQRLQGILEPLAPSAPFRMSADAAQLVEQTLQVWKHARHPTFFPLIQLTGPDRESKITMTEQISRKMNLPFYYLHADSMPADRGEFVGFLRLWERETLLQPAGLVLEIEESAEGGKLSRRQLREFLQHTVSPVLIVTENPVAYEMRPSVNLQLPLPRAEDQQRVWKRILGKSAARLNGTLRLLCSQFNLSERQIQNAALQAISRYKSAGGSEAGGKNLLSEALRDACREQARPRLSHLAQPVCSNARWEHLVLPDPQKRTLEEIILQLKHRLTVYEKWGFAEQSNRGLGISALFAGPSGTGKTLAAEVIANELGLDLFRIDLSSVVSKYIGETEKNLRKVFDAAESGGAILLFDEADALFGKRTEVKDSHDRYANIEVSYLLQRMEAYRGLAILTTNMKQAIDNAFLRRIRFVVQFPFPDATLRMEIWKRIFPPKTPLGGLDFQKLAQLNISGGNIRNIALKAAFFAADGGSDVEMVHLRRAARSEFLKMEKVLSEADLKGWE